MTDLIVIQASPFCNLDCSYCYLGAKNITKLMDLSTIEIIFQKLKDQKMFSSEVTVVWHAGEPLAVPLDFYKEAFRIIDKLVPSFVSLTHSFQTNGTLITQGWCDFIKKHRVKIGLSIDGPSSIHDKYRIDRSGRGTLSKTLKGMDNLIKNGIPFSVLSVVTTDSIENPFHLMTFLLNRVPAISYSFNVEEIEARNTSSSLTNISQDKIVDFFKTIFIFGSANNMKIREYSNSKNAIEYIDKGNYSNQEATPFRILNFSFSGDFSTFSPELLGEESEKYTTFKLGNIHEDNFNDEVVLSNVKRLEADIVDGVRKCEKECEFFKLCGGGTPSNKYFEHGHFSSTETLHCVTHLKAPVLAALSSVESIFRREKDERI